MSVGDDIKRIPERFLPSTIPIPRKCEQRYRGLRGSKYVRNKLGVRAYNEICLEIQAGGHVLKDHFISGIGYFFVWGVMTSPIILFQFSWPIPSDVWFMVIAIPIVLAAFAGLFYAIGRISRGGRGSCIRLNRQTRKVYYVFPRSQLVTLDWDELQPLAGIIPIGSFGASSSYNPLFLQGVDWTYSPPQEFLVPCGNMAWGDGGESARKLWRYIQHFMDHGPEGLPALPPLPLKMSRNQTFLHGYRQWGRKFREDLSTPKGKRWAVLWGTVKVLWLFIYIFPDSIEKYLDYTVSEMQFSEGVDRLCGFKPPSDE